MPLEWYTLYVDYKFRTFQECAAVRMLTYMTHFASSIMNFFVISAMVLHRYNKFKKQDIDGFSKNTRSYLSVAIGCGGLLMCPIAWDIWKFLEFHPSECLFPTVTDKGRSWMQTDLMMKCNSVFAHCSTFVTIVTVACAITVSSRCINYSTRLLTSMIRKADGRANTILQMRRSTNTSRIQATTYLALVFSFNWVPYGLSRFYVLLNPTFPAFQTVTTCFHALSTVLFVFIPLIYYKMDGGFQKFANALFAKITSTATTTTTTTI